MAYTDEELVPSLLPLVKRGIADTTILTSQFHHVTDRDEGHNDVDEQGRSRTCSSRTFCAGFASGEKHPELTAPLVLFWGL